MNPDILAVSGADGFLGSGIVEQATRAGIQLRALSRRSDSRGEPYVHADLFDIGSLTTALAGVRQVIHAAGLAHVFGRPNLRSSDFYHINETGTANIAAAAARAGVEHFVLISSVAVYGPSDAIRTEKSPCRPAEPYARSKLLSEERAKEVAEQAGMRLTILRMAALYGEGDRGNVSRLMNAIEKGRFIWIGRGTNRKTLLYRGDAARACIMTLSRETPGTEVFNVAAPPVTMREVVNNLAAALGKHVPNVHIPARVALGIARVAAALGPVVPERARTLHATLAKWIADDVYDGTRLALTFNFKREVSLAEGLSRQVRWARAAAMNKQELST